MNVTVLTIDSATKLPPEADGAVIVTGSHGAVYAAYLCAKAGVRAAIHHDAGIGLDEAGVGGLAYAEKLGMAMAAIATESARIGDAGDLLVRGRISRANAQALACGVAIGMSCREAVERLKRAPWPHRPPPTQAEGRYEVDGTLCLDSASMLGPNDHGRVAATGSHGALIAGTTTAPMRPRLIMFNDAGPCIERAGIRGLDVPGAGQHRRHRRGSALGTDRRWPVHFAGRNDLCGQSPRLPPGCACGRAGTCLGPTGGRKGFLEHIRSSGMCPCGASNAPQAHFRLDGTARGSI